MVEPWLASDPTEVMVRNTALALPDYAFGVVLLFLYVMIQSIAVPLALIRDAKPISYKVVRTPENAFIPSYKMGYDLRGVYIDDGREPRIHYVDEGNRYSNETLVLLHGEPFWSYCWIKLIPYLTSAGYRVIAPDFIGFGKSDKYVDYRAYNISLHKSALYKVMEKAQPVGKVTLVGHNWGWMIGAAFAKDFPNLFDRYVILNTNNIPDGELTVGRYSHPTVLWRFAIMNAFFLAFNAAMNLMRELFPLTVLIWSMNRRYTLKELEGFLTPHQSLSERGGTTSFPLMVPVFPSHPEAPEMNSARSFLSSVKAPTLVVYSESSLIPWLEQGDFVVGNRQVFYEKLIPGARDVVRIPDGGHLIMYDQPSAVAHSILHFLRNNAAFL